MCRWLVQLEGEPLDLEEFPKRFPSGDVFGIEEQGKFFITGPTLNAMTDTEAVLERAMKALDEFAGVIFLLWPAFRKPFISQVIREDDTGARTTYAGTTGTASSRSKANGVGEDASGTTKVPSTTQAQDMLLAAENNSHLLEALRVWSDPIRHWGRLYRVWEEVERHIKEHFHKEPYEDEVGLGCSRNECERFTRTAHCPETAGLDSRHASSDRHKPPANPMSLQEATSFIGRLLGAALRKSVQLDRTGPTGSSAQTR